MTVFLESLRLAFSSLRANPLRAFLTILGIVIGVVTLTGTVDTQANSEKAKARTMAINGVKEVNNRLVVTPAK